MWDPENKSEFETASLFPLLLFEIFQQIFGHIPLHSSRVAQKTCKALETNEVDLDRCGDLIIFHIYFCDVEQQFRGFQLLKKLSRK